MTFFVEIGHIWLNRNRFRKNKKETARNCAELSWADHIGNVLNMFLWLWSATFGQNLGLNYLRKIKDVSNEAWSDVAELKLGWLKYNPWISSNLLLTSQKMLMFRKLQSGKVTVCY